MLQIVLYDRWFDSQQPHVDDFAQRLFDPADEGTLVCSAEFLAELGGWAERCNEEREAAYLEVSAGHASRTQRDIERERVAEELARIRASEITRA